ncbi:MAG: tetratricopeptide repeat protein [Rhodospirillaceae bacterium]|nr:tetratricopeptide repeat protein [Rhodospirillaceae bacterium]
MSAAPTPDLASTIALMIRGAREAINLGSFEVAETLCQEALSLDPAGHAQKLLMGRIKFIQKDFILAQVYLEQALALVPNDAVALLLLARCHRQFQRWPQAIEFFTQAFSIRPATAAEQAELGHCYGNSGEHAEAAACFSRSVGLDSKNPEVWNDLGSSQIELGDLGAAQKSFEAALALQPAAVEPWRNLALVNEWCGRPDAALDAHDHLVTLRPDDAAAKQKRGVTRLSHGKLVEGWADYRARFVNPAHKGWHGGIPKPMWDGAASLADKGILVWSDQGLGDQILVASLLPDVKAAAKHVVFACEPRLIPLMQRSFPKVRVVSLLDVPYGRVDLADVDVQASISELGPAFRPAIERFPSHAGCLKADAAKVAQLKSRYAALPGAGPIVGLSWHSTNELAGGNKSVALDQWTPILRTPGVRFVCLQYGDVAAEVRDTLAKLDVTIFVDPAVDAIKDVDLFAAQVAAMDAVISTSNTTVHMAAALNVPTFCLTPRVEGRPWYWFVGREVSPWYPSVRHIWQTKRRHWSDVIEVTAQALGAQVNI